MCVRTFDRCEILDIPCDPSVDLGVAGEIARRQRYPYFTYGGLLWMTNLLNERYFLAIPDRYRPTQTCELTESE